MVAADRNPLDELAQVFKALASEHRREILRVLSECTPQEGKSCCGANEMCACKISEHLGLSAATVSHHMSALRRAGLVEARKDGTWTYYSLRRDTLETAAEALRHL